MRLTAPTTISAHNTSVRSILPDTRSVSLGEALTLMLQFMSPCTWTGAQDDTNRPARLSGWQRSRRWASRRGGARDLRGEHLHLAFPEPRPAWQPQRATRDEPGTREKEERHTRYRADERSAEGGRHRNRGGHPEERESYADRPARSAVCSPEAEAMTGGRRLEQDLQIAVGPLTQ